MRQFAIPLSLILLGTTAAAGLAQPRSAKPIVISRAPAPRTPASAEEARALANEFADSLEKEYLSAEIGARYARVLRRNAAAGAYDNVGDAVALADKMTSDVQAVNKDAHLGMYLRGFGPAEKAEKKARAGDGPPPRPNPIGDTKWVADGVAYMAIHFMPQHDPVLNQVRSFMETHADAKAIILDVRECTGGSIHMTETIASYLYPKPTTLVRMDGRNTGGPAPMEGPKSAVSRKAPAGMNRTDQVITPHPTEKRLFDAKVYALTSKHSISACEHLPFALQQTGRATIVGETTAGAGNYGTFKPMGKRFLAFIPMGRTYNPKTGKGWEGTGIVPNVRVPADQALDTAIRLATNAKGAGAGRR